MQTASVHLTTTTPWWRRLNGFQKLALATTIATYILIMVGGFVRAAGAGLGCPDWPKCFGYIWPPSEASELAAKGFDPALFNPTLMWIEYINRLMGVLVGFLIILSTIWAVRFYRQVPRVLWPTVAAFVLVLIEGWVGAKVVEYELGGWIVSIHLVLALVIGTLLIYATVCAFFPGGKPLSNIPADRRQVARLTQAIIGLALVQLSLGALVRGHLDDVVSKQANLPRSEWIAQVGITDSLHRIGALLLTMAVLGLAWFIIRSQTLPRWMGHMAKAAGALILIQVAAGLGLAYGAIPPPLQVVHLIVGSSLIAVLTMIVLLAYRLPVVQREGMHG